jgi:colicin import membrane protein
MNTLRYYEDHKFSAGALALVIHAIFFCLLYFSFNWHVKRPPNMIVEMWDTLPDTIPAPAPEIIPAPTPLPLPVPVLKPAETISIPKAPEPAVTAKAEIVFKEKKKQKKPVPVAKPTVKPETKIQNLETEKQLAKAAQVQQEKKLELADQQAREKQLATEEQIARENTRAIEHKERIRAEVEAATASEVVRYKEMIQAKISRNIVMPPDVPDSAEAKFMVIVLPGGSVMNDGVKLIKSSGNAAYDSAAERAIYKAQPLPMPQDEALARMFRELRLSVKP